MEPYKNRDGNSGVLAYEIRPDAIRVWFAAAAYEYTYGSAGRDAVEMMKKLAIAGRGLSTYISQEDPPYARKWKAESPVL
jgi:hypothetical protein